MTFAAKDALPKGFVFTGKVEKVTVDLGPVASAPKAGELRTTRAT
jgi:hypothetical protein